MTSRFAVRPVRLLALAVALGLLVAPLPATSATVAPGSIAGTVQRAGGDPVAGAVIDVWQQGTSDEVYYVGSVETSAAGTYAVKGLPPGSYRIGFSPPESGPNSDLAVEYYENTRTLEDAHGISVRSGVVNRVDADLEVGGRITGMVTKPNGEPLPGALIFGYPREGSAPATLAVAQTDGSYTLKGLSAGPQRLRFFGPMDVPDPFDDSSGAYHPEWWEDKAVWTAADAIAITAGQTASGKNAQLRLRGTPVTNLKRPSISGSPEVGEPLVGDDGQWSPDGGTLAYSWFVDGVATSNKGDTFVPELAHVGKSITFKVTVWNSDVSATSDPTSPVASGGPLHNTAKPKLTAEQVGNTAQITPGEWSAYHVTRTHQVLADGVEVPGATKSFAVTPDLIGKRLSVRETVTLPGRATTTVVSEETAPITMGEIKSIEAPRIYDAPIVGVPLKTTDGRWTLNNYQQVERFEYTWRANGVEIDGADQPTFTPTAAQSGKTLTAEVTAKREGFASATAISNPTAAVAGFGDLHVQAGVQEIYGYETPQVGRSLYINPRGWEPGNLTYTYQWRADGQPIAGATSNSFTVTSEQAGTSISVVITGSRNGYTSASAVSEPVLIPASTPFGAPIGLHSTATTSTTIELAWTKVEGAAKYRIYSGIGSGERTKLEVGKVTSAIVKGLKPDTVYSIDIAALKSDGTRSSYSPRINVRTAALSRPTDLTVIDQTPSSVKLSWTKVPGVPNYRIGYRIGSDSRKIVTVGDVNTKTITGLQPGRTYSIDIASQLSDGTRSSYSPRVEATTPAFHPPTDLRATDVTSSRITVAWTKSPGAVKYRLYYGRPGGSRTRIEVGDVSGLTIKNLKSGRTYTIDVSAFTSSGYQSKYTPRISVTTD